MAYNFQNRLAHNRTRMKQVNSEEVTYTRSGSVPLTISASPIMMGSEDFGNNMLVRVDSQMWGIDVADLGVLSLPKENDLITRSNGEKYRVLKFSDRDTTFMYTTSAHTRVLINSRKVL